jgi:hypothetical protein
VWGCGKFQENKQTNTSMIGRNAGEIDPIVKGYAMRETWV